MPSEAAIRVEEIVNAFDYGYRAPSDRTFSINAEAAPSPNRAGYHVLHIGVKGKEVAKADRKPADLIFVIDVSGSMSPDNRLGLVKRSLRLLVEQLGEADRVGIVTYGSQAREVLQPTSAYRKADIIRAIDNLSTEGATNAEAGSARRLQAMAERHFRKPAIDQPRHPLPPMAWRTSASPDRKGILQHREGLRSKPRHHHDHHRLWAWATTTTCSWSSSPTRATATTSTSTSSSEARRVFVGQAHRHTPGRSPRT